MKKIKIEDFYLRKEKILLIKKKINKIFFVFDKKFLKPRKKPRFKSEIDLNEVK
jgi:hypothetical protein